MEKTMTKSTKSRVLRLPYGESLFAGLLEDNFAYVDKTQGIELLESLDSRYPFVVRPRRFGKSLFCTMLRAYYDKSESADFERNFSGTYISRHKTALQGQFYVLAFDFSGFGSSPDVPESFSVAVKNGLGDFFSRYPVQGSEKLLDKTYKLPGDLLDDFFGLVAPMTGRKIFIIIDEYDQFANQVLAQDKKQFSEMTSSEGFLKDFYSKIKAGTKLTVARTFITGVTPISMDSMTSGFSIAKNFTTFSQFNTLFGFTEKELKWLIEQTIDCEALGTSVEGVFARMKKNYNGYRFSSKAGETVFNSSMCLNYLLNTRSEGEEPTGADLMDASVDTDLSKIHGILSLGERDFVERIVQDALRGIPIEMSAPSTTINLNNRQMLSGEDVLSTLFYMGYLTYQEGAKSLVCPNAMVRRQFFRYYLSYLTEIGPAARMSEEKLAECNRAALDGDLSVFLRYTAQTLESSVGLHSRIFLSETQIEFYLLAAAMQLSDFTARAEVEALGKGYVDILFCSGKRSYLVELKYAPQTDAGKVPELLSAAREQLAGYAQAANIASLPNLQKIAVVFAGPQIRELEVVP